MRIELPSVRNWPWRQTKCFFGRISTSTQSPSKHYRHFLLKSSSILGCRKPATYICWNSRIITTLLVIRARCGEQASFFRTGGFQNLPAQSWRTKSKLNRHRKSASNQTTSRNVYRLCRLSRIDKHFWCWDSTIGQKVISTRGSWVKLGYFVANSRQIICPKALHSSQCLKSKRQLGRSTDHASIQFRKNGTRLYYNVVRRTIWIQKFCMWRNRIPQ